MVSATSDLACSKSTDGITMEYGCSLTRYQLICLVIQTFTSGVLSLPQVQPVLSITAKAVCLLSGVTLSSETLYIHFG